MTPAHSINIEGRRNPKGNLTALMNSGDLVWWILWLDNDFNQIISNLRQITFTLTMAPSDYILRVAVAPCQDNRHNSLGGAWGSKVSDSHRKFQAPREGGGHYTVGYIGCTVQYIQTEWGNRWLCITL